MGFKVWGVLVVVVFCALVCNVLGSGDAGAMDDGSERYGSNRYDMGMMEDVGEGEGGGEGFVGGGKGFMLGERLHLINYVFASLKRYSLDLYQAVDWGKLSHEDRLEILAKVKVVADTPDPDEDDRLPDSPVTTTDVLQPFIEIVATEKKTVLEVLMGLCLGYYDMLNADATKETTEAMFEAAKRSAEIERNLDEVDKEYKRQVKEMEEVKNPRIYMEADGLRAAHRTVLILLIHLQDTGDELQRPEPIEDEEYEGKNPYEMLAQAKKDHADFQELQRKSAMRGEKRPFPDMDWRAKSNDIRSRLVKYERLVRRAEIKGHVF